ncbi:MAG: hypothetical protein AAFY72_04595 [Cyanobacteria bacterium J06649_4]
MKLRLLLASSFVCCLMSLPAYANNCSPGSPSSNEYIRRDNNRCEGVIRRDSPITGDISLRSLTSSIGTTLNSTLVIQIPNFSSSQPNIEISEPDINYRLNDLSLESSDTFYRFELPTSFLNRHGITSANPLRGLAKKGGSQTVYLPIIFDNPAPEYRFVFNSTRPAIFTKAEIRQSNGESLVSWGVQRRNPRGEKEFKWTPGDVVAGQYTFYFEAEVEQSRGRVQSITRSIPFEHNPDWLR